MGTCHNCKTDFGRRKNRIGKYCSHKCQNDYQNKQTIKEWKAGRFNGVRGEQLQLSQPIRNYIIAKAENQCSKCGWREYHPVTGRVPLQVHHIDGNAMNTVEKNLEALCPNCHAMTPNYGKLNKLGRTLRHRRLTEPHKQDVKRSRNRKPGRSI